MGENTVLQLNILETGVITLVVQNSSPTRLRLVGDELRTTCVRTPVSKMFRWRTYNYFDGAGFFRIRKSSSMHPTSPESYLASSRHRGFFERNTMVDVCISASVGMIYNEHNSSCMSYFWCTIKLILDRFICNMLLNTYNI